MDIYSALLSESADILSTKPHLVSSTQFSRRFRSHFGVSLDVATEIYDEILTQNIDSDLMASPKHLLWALYFLKVYPTEGLAAALFRISEKTYRKYVHQTIHQLSELNLISFEDRWENWSLTVPSCYVDGTDCNIPEKCPMRTADFSHKLNHSAFRYEIASALGCSKIVHAAGGVPAGDWPDLRLARQCLVPKLGNGEKVAADRGYRDQGGSNEFFHPLTIHPAQADFAQRKKRNRMIELMGARHETINKRLKDFSILSKPFRHSREWHPIIFHAVVNITQINLQHEPLFDLKLKLIKENLI